MIPDAPTADEHPEPPHEHRHEPFGTVNSALLATAQGMRATWISLTLLAATAVAQTVVVILTGSVALLADTIHNFTDALTAVPLLIAFRLGRRPANRRYTYGYHRAEDVAGLAIVAMIAASAVFAGFEAIDRLRYPAPLDHVWVVLTAGVIGFLGNEAVAIYRMRVGRAIGSAALFADGVHARADGLTSLGVVAGAIGVLVGFPRADAIVGLLITLAIGYTLVAAARTVLRRVLDGIDEPTMRLIEAAAATVRGVEHVSEARARWVGHQLRAELAIDVSPDITVEAGHDIAEHVREALLHDVPRLGEAMVHVDPHEHDPHVPG
ncbi:MAG: cation diffusion facilitator family transporter [Actinomycetota bacterium]